jgi:NADPH2:quinone reductase
MRAIRVNSFGGPENLLLEDVAEPRAGAGQVIVRIHAAGVNPVDTYIRGGAHAVKPDLPYTPGIDGAGTVVAAGPDVTRFVPGERVYVSSAQAGTYAETIACAESQAYRLPAAASFEQGAAIGVSYVTAFRALFQIARAVPGESVLVHGASGGTGTAAVQLAHAAGLTVIGTAGTEAGRALVREQGASHALDHNDPGLEKELLELTGGRGVDIVIEMLANKNLAVDLRLVARRGRIVVVGSRGPVEINPRDAMVREASILGTFLFGMSAAELSSAHAALQAALENGTARPVVGRSLPLAEARKAHELVLQPGAAGKIVLLP